MHSVEVKYTSTFGKWLDALTDVQGKVKILARIGRLQAGNPGDTKPVGDGISEMRIDFGPGYRVYYKRTGKTVTVILAGGDKASQDRDIKTAKTLLKNLEA